MASVKSGPNNAEWVKTRDTAHDISCGTADFKSGADYGENKIKETEIDLKGVIGDETEKDIDAEKSTAAKVWDQTKDIAENVTHSAYNMGTEICGAVKHGAEAGWNKVAGD